MGLIIKGPPSQGVFPTIFPMTTLYIIYPLDSMTEKNSHCSVSGHMWKMSLISRRISRWVEYFDSEIYGRRIDRNGLNSCPISKSKT